MAIKRGDIKYYQESGVIFKVQVLDINDRNYANTKGEEYKLKLLEVIDSNGFNPPESGLEFCVWKSKDPDAAGYAGWHLLER